ncbi:ADP-ribosylglycohydrolase [Fontibacillus phaseoli]|uniref:ADP-ribosylglycohydrolase n=1 Tax=Fontibacillus phaseoli TaxID=1416533 RepID=A0A369BN55_9BACL|nr:ADP-ribosylglycohydrolase family protein [Fontibacillus phaseoli]RCX22515.1 ADP-ribosylglycohydrolase [Fontibacillus phaseoli]
MTASSLDRYKGCLIGLAVGDAIGTTVEFQAPGSFAPVTDMVGGGVFQLRAGQWTDDTSMALCLGESLLNKQGFDPKAQMARYHSWMRHGYLSSTGECFDIGNATREAILNFERTGEGYSGSQDPNSAGNGSIMRLAPVPMFYGAKPESAIHFAGLSSKTTHAATECIDACMGFAACILGALYGWSKEDILSDKPIKEFLGAATLAPKVEEVLGGSYKDSEPPLIRGTGYVVKSLEAALWAFHKSNTYEEGVLLAVNLGEDADTTAAVYGQLAGAFYGFAAIPGHWVNKLAYGDLIEDLAEQLYKHAYKG